jgi:hypothetical protein
MRWRTERLKKLASGMCLSLRMFRNPLIYRVPKLHQHTSQQSVVPDGVFPALTFSRLARGVHKSFPERGPANAAGVFAPRSRPILRHIGSGLVSI